jgi:nucleotide-binding universal stress UspA family protein
VTLRSILTAVDFSEQSREALRCAGAFATRFQARLTVVSVVDPLLAEAARIRLGRDLRKTETEPALREFVAATWADSANRSAQTFLRVAVGDPASAILETATAESADLIVMGTQGLGGFRKWLLGSTTERLLRRTHLPVLAVPPSSGSHGTISRGSISRLVAATDFSKPSVAAAKMAAQLTEEFSAQLTIVHVVEPLAVPTQWLSLVEESDEMRVGKARAELKRLVEQSCGSQKCEDVVMLGRAADAIGSIAGDRRAEMIVMGLASDGGAFAPRPGTIAYRVLSSTMIPVLVVAYSTK